MAPLFTTDTRAHAVPSHLVVDNFRWLDQSPRPCADAARRLCNDMFTRYPNVSSDRDQARNELRGRFCDNNNSGHNSAFWELLLHEVFLKIGYQVEAHPELGGKNPDFRVVTADGNSVLIEAACLLPELEADQSAQRRLEDVFVALNDYPRHTEFDFMVSHNGTPSSQVPKKQLYEQLDNFIGGVTATDADEDDRALNFTHDGWRLRVALLPSDGRSEKRSRIASRGTLDAYHMRAIERARSRADDKASAYGQVPIVIAINLNEHIINDDDVATLLYGSLCATFSVAGISAGPTEAFRGRNRIKPPPFAVLGAAILRDRWRSSLSPTASRDQGGEPKPAAALSRRRSMTAD